MNTTHLKSRLFAAALCALPAAKATLITFDTHAQFHNNFVEAANGNSTLWNAGGYLAKSSGGTTTLVYNENDNVSAGANRATATYDNPRNLVGGTNPVIFTADFLATTTSSANGLGFYLKVPNATENTTPAGGYLVIFRTTEGNSALPSDVRFWDYSASNSAATAGVGTLSQTTRFDSATNGAANTWYTAKLEMQDVGSTVVFNASLYYQGGAKIGNTVQYISSNASGLGAGQWALRVGIGTGAVQVDNVGFAVIPEPGTLALVGVALGSMLILRRRKR